MENLEQKEFLEKNFGFLPKKILEYHNSIKDVLSLNDMNIMEKSLVASELHLGFLTAYYAEQGILKKLEESKLAKENEYMAKYGKDDVPKFKTTHMFELTEENKNLSSAIETQKMVLRYLNDALDVLGKFSFNIKNAVELIKRES